MNEVSERAHRSRWPRANWPRILYAAPVVGAGAYGALWIALHAQGGRGSTHMLFQTLALAESLLALLMRRRKPVAAFAGIVAVSVVFSLDSLLLPAVLFALLTVAIERDRRTAALAATVAGSATVAWPYIGGRTVSFTGDSLPHLAAFGVTAAAGMYLRAHLKGAR